jgi:CRP-like cAMP-binding protein
MVDSALGRVYEAGAVIIRQGDSGDCLYVVQEGQVEVVVEQAGEITRLAVRGAGELFGEMAIFERQARMATVRALGRARILKVDKKNLLRSIHEDPSLAFHSVEILSQRVRELSREVALLRLSTTAAAAGTTVEGAHVTARRQA